jgi:hypothetical protein
MSGIEKTNVMAGKLSILRIPSLSNIKNLNMMDYLVKIFEYEIYIYERNYIQYA